MAFHMSGYAMIILGIHKQFPGCNYVVNSASVGLLVVVELREGEISCTGVDWMGDVKVRSKICETRTSYTENATYPTTNSFSEPASVTPNRFTITTITSSPRPARLAGRL